METYQGVAITDGVNRKNHVFPLNTIVNLYRDSWKVVIPMNLGHDRTKPIGYTILAGVYMEPGKAYLTNKSVIMETKEEHKALNEMIKAYDYKIFCEEHKKELDTLIDELGDKLSEEFCVAPVGQAVAINDKNIVYRLFPEWSEKIKDGLVDIRELDPVYTKDENGQKGVLVPGLYCKEGYLLFAHRFFRRSLSILNTTNEEFFYSFEKLRDISSIKLQIALDMDMIGLLGTEQLEMEYQYIRGPYFNDDLSCIPEGVTCYENEHYDNVFSNLLSTQFYWHIQDGKRIFECEELCDRENIFFDEEQTMFWGCRYVHSMINPNTGLPNHLDGAIRIYNDAQILDRIDSKTDISKYGKNSEYIKLWRIDDDFSIVMWKEIISSFYRENALIGEYFGGMDEKYDRIRKEKRERNSVAEKPNKFAHITLNKGDGIRIYFRYIDRFELIEDRDVDIYNKESFVVQGGKQEEALDAESITLFKYLKRKGINLQIPNTTWIEFGDMIFNFPTFCCKNLMVADIVIDSIKEFCETWVNNNDDRLLSFGFAVNLVDKAIHVSFAGHVNDFVNLFESIPKLSDVAFEPWIETIYKKNNIFKEGKNYPDKFHLIRSDAVCFERCIIHPNIIEKIWIKDGKVSAVFNISEEEQAELLQYQITAAPVYKIIKSKCSKCGKTYSQCSCVKFIDENVFDVVEKADLLGLIWTNRSAFSIY